ncbi:TatD family hydrolase [bacterium]|nr:TatD family hydrolase [bacterium]
MIITDNHMHLDPQGLGIEAAKKFQRAGGTHLFIIYKYAEDYGINVKNEKDFERAYDIVIKMCKRVNDRTDLKAYCIIGIHPAEVVELYKKYGEKKTWDLCMKTFDIIAEKYVEKEIVGIGEIGRPHFPVSDEIMEFSQKVMNEGLKLSRELNCAVQLHLESFENREKFYELEKTVKRYGKKERVIKHFAPPEIKIFEEIEIMPSVIASENNIRKAIKEGNRFLMETDYIDDLKRPGAVMGPKTVPRTTLKLLRAGVLDEEDIFRIHKENIEKVYGIDLNEP